jgi:hypothetical protein
MSADIDPEEGETMQMQSLTDVLADQLGDLYSAERQLVKALPNVAKAAHSDELREAFEHHWRRRRSMLPGSSGSSRTRASSVSRNIAKGWKG